MISFSVLRVHSVDKQLVSIYLSLWFHAAAKIYKREKELLNNPSLWFVLHSTLCKEKTNFFPKVSPLVAVKSGKIV